MREGLYAWLVFYSRVSTHWHLPLRLHKDTLIKPGVNPVRVYGSVSSCMLHSCWHLCSFKYSSKLVSTFRLTRLVFPTTYMNADPRLLMMMSCPWWVGPQVELVGLLMYLFIHSSGEHWSVSRGGDGRLGGGEWRWWGECPEWGRSTSTGWKWEYVMINVVCMVDSPDKL